MNKKKMKVIAKLVKVTQEEKDSPEVGFSSQRQNDFTNLNQNVYIAFNKLDGSLYFSDENDESFVYLYKEQVKHLESILKKRAKLL